MIGMLPWVALAVLMPFLLAGGWWLWRGRAAVLRYCEQMRNENAAISNLL